MRDPVQYARFSDERSRPFFTLLSRVPEKDYGDIVDLGCGPGELTKALVERWPEARIVGLDSSPEMLAGSGKYAVPGHLEFELGKIEEFDQEVDLMFSNAALQWLDDHETLIPRLARLVRPRGVFAFQVPNNWQQPSHTLVEDIAREGPWAQKLAMWKQRSVQPLRWYMDTLLEQGFEVEGWETNYHFVLEGEDPVLEWVKGTSLQPILHLLEGEHRQSFTDIYAERLRDAYPPTSRGTTIYPFRRLFVVAERMD
jgi:trans-aconitate 2-methyltransferase